MNSAPLQPTWAARAVGPPWEHTAVDSSSRAILQSVWDDAARELVGLTGALGVPADQVEDVLQEVYISAWQKQPDCAGAQQLKWWLIRVLTNRCHLMHRQQDRWRRIRGLVARLRPVPSADATLADGAIHREHRTMVGPIDRYLAGRRADRISGRR